MAAQLSLGLTGYELMQAVRASKKLTHAPYGSKLTPVKHCLARLFDKEVMSLSRLLACHCPQGLKDAAIAEHPADMNARKADLSGALLYELDRYGCILLATNPYHQPQIWAPRMPRQ